MRNTLLLFGVILCVAAPHVCWAEFQFLGPTPYKSAAESPFPVDGSAPDFFLEDFEDGLLNSPGVTLNPGFFEIVGPSPTTDSVDGDDGLVDGFGAGGWAMQRIMAPDLLGYPTYSTGFRFIFSESELGFLPNAFGFVWTDGPAPTSGQLFLTDETLTIIGATTFFGLGDSSDRGETDEDRFIGTISTLPFATALIILNFESPPNYPGLPWPTAQIDHVQYGLIVPEPGAIVLLATSIVGWPRARTT